MKGNSTNDYINEARRQWLTIIKYSTIVNGTALALSLNAVTKGAGGLLAFPIGKFPIWLSSFRNKSKRSLQKRDGSTWVGVLWRRRAR
jgi:hypothetical protein